MNAVGESGTSTGVAAEGRGATSAGGDRLLRDPVLDATLQAEGFVLAPLLDRDEVRAITESYQTLVPEVAEDLVIDYVRTDRSVMRQVAEILEPYWDRHLPELFLDGRPVLTTLVTKHPGEASYMFLHDDRTYVDEAVHRSATLWVPLVDVGPDLDNGCLELVRGSHRIPTGMAGTGTPDHIRPHEAYLRSRLEPVTAAAGTAVVYDSRLLHASGPNRSDRPRYAIVCAVAPRPAQLIHVVGTGRRHRVVHAVDERFFLEHGPRELEQAIPEAFPVVREFEDDRLLHVDDLVAVFGGPHPDAPGAALPPDLHRFTEVAQVPLPVWRTGRRGARTDLVQRAADLGPGDWAATHLTGVEVTGQVGHRVLRANHRRRGSWAGLHARAALDGIGTRDAVLLLLDPGSRLTFDVPAGCNLLEVSECPPVGAGVACADGAANLGLETVVALPADARTTIWNDGPGVVAAVLARVPRVHPVSRRASRVRGAGRP